MNLQGFPPATTSFGGLQCVTGTVNLFQFIQPPAPGSIIGTITPWFGTPISLIQTQQTPLGGIPLSSVNGRVATVCGVFTQRGNQTVLDVRAVNPGAPSPTGTPFPFDNRLLLLGLLGNLNLSGADLTNLVQSLTGQQTT